MLNTTAYFMFIWVVKITIITGQMCKTKLFFFNFWTFSYVYTVYKLQVYNLIFNCLNSYNIFKIS